MVVIRKSPRSFAGRVRSPTTEIPEEVVVMRSTPLNGFGSNGKMLEKSVAVCPDAGREIGTGELPLRDAPLRSVTSNITDAGDDEVLATAIPESILIPVSTYIRNAVP